MTKDLTQGSPVRLILGFALPLLAGMLFQQLYNLVDTLIVGRFLGMEALAGVGATGSINFLVLGFCMGVCSGFAIPVAQQFGAHEESRMREFVANGTWLSIVFAVVMTVLTVVYCADILRAMNTPEDCFQQAYNYIVVIFAGIPFTFLYNLLSGWLRSLGDSKTPLFFLVLSSVLNVILDLAFILIFRLGVFGASLATVLSQAVSAAWVLRFLTGPKSGLHIRRANLRPNGKVMARIAGLGIAPFIMQSTESLVSITLNSGLQHFGGDLYVGTITILQSVMQMFMLPMQGISQGSQPIISYNFGAKNYRRVRQTARLLLKVCCTFTVLACLVGCFGSRWLARLFTPDAELVGLTALVARIYFAGIWAFGMQMACQCCFMGMGQAKISLFLALLRKVILLVPLAILLPRLTGSVFGIYAAEPIADILASCTAITLFLRKRDQLLPAD